MMLLNSPLALIASGNEWLARSFESVLSANGYSVLQAFTTNQVLDHIRLVQPDAVFIDSGFPSVNGGIGLCRTLRDGLHLPPSLPVMLIMSMPTSRQERLEALRAGAWEVFGIPLDVEALIPQLKTFVAAKLEADQSLRIGLLDPPTGLYNVQGLLRKAQELGSTASRHNHALACIVFGPAGEMSGPELSEAEIETVGSDFPTDLFADLFKGACRAGDALGRLGQNEFVVLAPDTGPDGALVLAKRITEAAGELAASDGTGYNQLRAGLYAVPNFATAEIQPVEMLVRATMALRRSRTGLSTERILCFDPNDPVIAN